MKCFCLGQQLIKSETKGLLFLINNSKRKLCIIMYNYKYIFYSSHELIVLKRIWIFIYK